MAYSTPQAVRAVLSRDANTDDYDTPASWADDQITDCIERADARIDNYLRALYHVPVAAPDGFLRDCSSVIAAYFLILTQSQGRDLTNNDPIRLRFDNVMAELTAASKSAITLPYPVEDTDQPGEGVVYNHYEGELFPVEDMLAGGLYTHVGSCNSCTRNNGTRCNCGW